MFVMEILQGIIIQFSFDMIKTFAALFWHTFSVTNSRLKLPKYIGDMAFTSDESVLVCFLLQGR